jgi:hypothetical protein
MKASGSHLPRVEKGDRMTLEDQAQRLEASLNQLERSKRLPWTTADDRQAMLTTIKAKRSEAERSLKLARHARHGYGPEPADPLERKDAGHVAITGVPIAEGLRMGMKRAQHPPLPVEPLDRALPDRVRVLICRAQRCLTALETDRVS